MPVLMRTMGMDNALKVVEFGGSTVRAMNEPERMVLSNVAAELGAKVLVAPDQTTADHLAAKGKPLDGEATALAWSSNRHALYTARHALDARVLAPQVAAPHPPDNSDSVAELGHGRH